MNWYKKAKVVNVAGEQMTLVSADIKSLINYELYYGKIKAAIRVKDIEVGEVIHLVVYPNHEKALQVYQETIQKA